MTPLLIFGYAWLFPESPADTGARRARSMLAAAIVYLQIAVVYLAMRLFALGGFAPKVGFWSLERMISMLPAAAWLYVRELVWPFHLTIFPRVTEVASGRGQVRGTGARFDDNAGGVGLDLAAKPAGGILRAAAGGSSTARVRSARVPALRFRARSLSVCSGRRDCAFCWRSRCGNCRAFRRSW